ncbi:hypothetical protein LAZ67_20001604 [Cordylochernes scorpioides]|uniref:Uncharacterized protein n=1 Tax=Cordylochernes scorpioides TaxID=51811 RepID=A0ABY6LMN8_9ARAC|nr:hypothetical protein LAZ67_20001604 [Cordylochernes scorpioides]
MADYCWNLSRDVLEYTHKRKSKRSTCALQKAIWWTRNQLNIDLAFSLIFGQPKFLINQEKPLGPKIFSAAVVQSTPSRIWGYPRREGYATYPANVGRYQLLASDLHKSGYNGGLQITNSRCTPFSFSMMSTKRPLEKPQDYNRKAETMEPNGDRLNDLRNNQQQQQDNGTMSKSVVLPLQSVVVPLLY